LFISFWKELNFHTLEELELELLVVNSRLTITGKKKKKKNREGKKLLLSQREGRRFLKSEKTERKRFFLLSQLPRTSPDIYRTDLPISML